MPASESGQLNETKKEDQYPTELVCYETAHGGDQYNTIMSAVCAVSLQVVYIQHPINH